MGFLTLDVVENDLSSEVNRFRGYTKEILNSMKEISGVSIIVYS